MSFSVEEQRTGEKDGSVLRNKGERDRGREKSEAKIKRKVWGGKVNGKETKVEIA